MNNNLTFKSIAHFERNKANVFFAWWLIIKVDNMKWAVNITFEKLKGAKMYRKAHNVLTISNRCMEFVKKPWKNEILHLGLWYFLHRCNTRFLWYVLRFRCEVSVTLNHKTVGRHNPFKLSNLVLFPKEIFNGLQLHRKKYVGKMLPSELRVKTFFLLKINCYC